MQAATPNATYAHAKTCQCESTSGTFFEHMRPFLISQMAQKVTVGCLICRQSTDLEQVASLHVSNRGFRIFQETVESTFVRLRLRHLVVFAFRRQLQIVLLTYVLNY